MRMLLQGWAQKKEHSQGSWEKSENVKSLDSVSAPLFICPFPVSG